MKSRPFDINDFLSASEPVAAKGATESQASVDEDVSIEEAPELDVQKAVVEELAADKAVLHEEIESLKNEISAKNAEIEQLKTNIEEKAKVESQIIDEKGKLAEQLEKEQAENVALKRKISELEESLIRKESEESEIQERNPNSLALLDRDVEMPDRFAGETRDHVIEVIKEARDRAESEGRKRRAQLLESVLVANEPSGNLEKKRKAMEKFFEENGNIVNGTVISELTRCGIAYKDGENYLLPKEIMLRTY